MKMENFFKKKCVKAVIIFSNIKKFIFLTV